MVPTNSVLKIRTQVPFPYQLGTQFAVVESELTPFDHMVGLTGTGAFQEDFLEQLGVAACQNQLPDILHQATDKYFFRFPHTHGLAHQLSRHRRQHGLGPDFAIQGTCAR